MRALTVRQPWAGAIIHRGKSPENRTRNIAGSYRGPVAIHVALRHDYATVDRFIEIAGWLDQHSTYGYGAFIGVVDLVDVHWSGMECSRCAVPCHEYELCSRWAQAYHHHLVLANPRPLPEPIPARGRLGLWTPAPEHLEQLQAVTR